MSNVMNLRSMTTSAEQLQMSETLVLSTFAWLIFELPVLAPGSVQRMHEPFKFPTVVAPVLQRLAEDDGFDPRQIYGQTRRNT